MAKIGSSHFLWIGLTCIEALPHIPTLGAMLPWVLIGAILMLIGGIMLLLGK